MDGYKQAADAGCDLAKRGRKAPGPCQVYHPLLLHPASGFFTKQPGLNRESFKFYLNSGIVTF